MIISQPQLTKLAHFKHVLRAYQIYPSKKLGQNFLYDPQVTDDIVSKAGGLDGRTVFEIGPGLGLLTRSLLKSSAREIYALEKDKRAIEILSTELNHEPRLTIEHRNALDCAIQHQGHAPRQIIANLPYNIATPLLLNWLSTAHSFEQMLLMFQAEVGERICAQPHQKLYGRLSVISQWCAQCEIVKKLPPDAFYPQPAVWSVVVRLKPHHTQPSSTLFQTMETLTRVAFGRRRKMLRSTLKGFYPPDLLERCQIDGRRRAETLTIDEFDKLAKTIARYNQQAS